MKRSNHPDADVMSRWFAYRLATHRDDDDEAIEHLRYVVERQPSAVNATQALVSHLVAQDALAEALEHLERLCEQQVDVGAYDWERMTVGTCLGQWASVRASATRVGRTLEGEGPINEAWELVMIQWRERS